MNWLRRILHRTHLHIWTGSGWSCRGAYTVEQRCTCNEYRHVVDLRDYLRGIWHPGQHPLLVVMRAAEAVA